MSFIRRDPLKFYGDRAAYDFACDYVDANIEIVQTRVTQLSARVDSIVVSGLPDTLDGGTF